MTQEQAEIHALALLEQLAEDQRRLREEFGRLHGEFERLAAHLAPMLTKQYRDTLAQVRILETRLRTRQERPLIVAMANLLGDIRRIESAQDVRVHVEEAMLDALTSAGCEETGAEGDGFDPGVHEPVSGSVGRAGVVTRVHRRGLSCCGDVIIKAKVDVQPASGPQAGQGEVQA
jgi:molecular chaperone GrpE (heat shock protein)